MTTRRIIDADITDRADGKVPVWDVGSSTHIYEDRLSGGPGTELDYVQKTTNTSVTATAEASADTVVTGAAVAYDGSTPVIIEFFTGGLIPPSDSVNRALSVFLYDGSSSIGYLTYVQNQGVSGGETDYIPLLARRRITPSAATHTYSIRATVSGNTGSVVAGAGGVGTNPPCYMRITKV